MRLRPQLSDRALREHLRPFRIGELIEARGVSIGRLDVVYEVSTTRGRFMLRIMDGRGSQDVRFEEAVLNHLAERGLTVPRMVGAGRHGAAVSIAPRRQLSIFQLVPGRALGVFEVEVEHARQVGELLGAMHQAGRGFRRQRRNRYGVPQLARMLERSVKLVEAAEHKRDCRALAAELVRHVGNRELPRGIVHGDLSIGNVRFSQGKLCSVVHFDGAWVGPLVADLGGAIVDWAFWHDRLYLDRARALVSGYQSGRKLEPAERGALFEACCFAAARLAVLHFHDYEVGARATGRHAYKDYRHFVRRLDALRSLGPQVFRDKIFGRAG